MSTVAAEPGTRDTASRATFPALTSAITTLSPVFTSVFTNVFTVTYENTRDAGKGYVLATRTC